MKTINIEMLRVNEDRRKAENAYRMELHKKRKAREKKGAGIYLNGTHLYELEETFYAPTKLTGQQRVMLGEEAYELNKRLKAEFHAHLCDCLDKNIRRTMPMRHWKLIDKNVEVAKL